MVLVFEDGFDIGALLTSNGIDMSELELVQDRKSTRLNSSHKPSSYAVFCLKKKKKH